MHGRHVFGAITARLILAIATIFIASCTTVLAQRDLFNHATAAHKKTSCNSCHKLPTANWVGASGFPDVADYPGHSACNSCHSGRQFLTLCNACHVTNITPRRAPRLAFPRAASPREFNSIFPHNVHQDIIASNERYRGASVAHMVNVAFVHGPAADDPPQFNNCAICHKTTEKLPPLVARTPPANTALAQAAADPFAAKPAYFKDMPTGHATCFACHYQNVEPVGTNCAGCHSLTTPYRERNEIKRYSFKFDHLQKEHSVRDCMTCHIGISQNADLKTLVNADVPFVACYSCHDKKTDEELKNRKDSLDAKAAPFQCIYCHTTEVGRFPVPPSHEKR